MPYVHLANGDVEKVTAKELAASQKESGTPNAFRKNGMEHAVIGVYPDEVEHPESEEVLAERAKQEKADKAEFDAWKANQAKPNTNPEADWTVGSQSNE
jgi:hypothetical protein